MKSERFAPLLFINGTLLCGLSTLMLLPAIADAAANNPDWRAFAVSASITLFVAIGLLLTSRSGEPLALDLRQAFLLTAGGWTILSVFSTLPFLLFDSTLDFSDAIFETISGLTTTGSTILVGLDNLPPGILLWRSLLQWVGGVGIILTAILMLPFLKVGGMQLFRTESSDRSDKVLPRTGQLATYIALVYGFFTVACFVAYVVGGMTAFDAINHSMTTVSTGGFSTHDASLGFFQNTYIDWIAVVFMVLGSLPFAIYIRALRQGPSSLWADGQVRTFLAFLLVAGLSVAWGLHVHEDIPFGAAVRRAVFNVTSVVTTTGYANEDYQLWGPFAIGCFVLLTFVGGCTGSTSGAIKIYRFQIVWRICRQHLLGLIQPNSVMPLSYNGKRLDQDILSSVLAFLFVYAASVIALSVALTAFEIDFLTSFSGAATALGNVGPGIGSIIGPAGNFATLPDGAKLLLAVGMLLGRLELFTVLVLFQAAFWRW
jgi:trk system potassium uptake protein TrkH